MNMISLLIAQASEHTSPINPQNIPGVVGIPTWLLVSCIVGLAMAIVGLFKIWLGREKKKDQEFTEATKAMVKEHNEKYTVATKDLKDALEAKIKEHRDAFQDQAKFWQQQLDKANEENLGLGRKLDERHDEIIKLVKEAGESLKVVDLVISHLKGQP